MERTEVRPQSDRAGPGQGPDPKLVGAALSKLVAASIGEVTTVLSRSAAHKFFALADIEWLVLPPVLAGQFYIAEASSPETGFSAPIACVTWARVSEEVDRRLTETAGQRPRLRPEEWTSGETAWLIDVAGEARGIHAALSWLLAHPFKDTPVKVAVGDGKGGAKVETLQELAAAAQAPGLRADTERPGA